MTDSSQSIMSTYPGKAPGEYRNDKAFAAIKEDGSVVTWGEITSGGDSSSVADSIDASSDTPAVTQVFSNKYAFAALRADGSVVTWGGSYSGDSTSVAGEIDADGTPAVMRVFSTENAFAALREDGSVVTWGNDSYGGDISSVSDELDADNNTSPVTQIFSTQRAFAALRDDGSVVTWGDDSSRLDYGSDSSLVADEIDANDGTPAVTQIFSNEYAFAALREDGSVVTWGDNNYGGYSSSVAYAIDASSGTPAVMQVFSTKTAFAALREDGSVVTWGAGLDGGDSSSVVDEIYVDNDTPSVTQIFSTDNSFAALREDGSVVTWGLEGGNSSKVAGEIDANSTPAVTQIFSTETAFAALREDGSVVTWGADNNTLNYGGDSSSVADDIDGNGSPAVMHVFSTQRAFAALREDGSVVTWGKGYGGDSLSVVDDIDASGTPEITQIFSTETAFAALREDGSVITWGGSYYGGDSSDVQDQLSSDIAVIASPFNSETVDQSNRIPVANNDTSTVVAGESVIIDVFANDVDADSDTLNLQELGSPDNGMVSTVDAGSVRYTPNEGFNGTDEFIYKISDGNGGTATGTVTVEVQNDSPIAKDDRATTISGEAVIIDVLGNDIDSDGDKLSIENAGDQAYAEVSVTDNDEIRYFPDANFLDYTPTNFSRYEEFTYTVSDGNGGSDTASVEVKVDRANYNPEANDDTAIATPGVPITIDVLDNDTDSDGDFLSIQSVSNPSFGTVSITDTDELLYTRGVGSTIYNDAFNYTVSDGEGGTDTASVVVNVEEPNQAPSAIDDSATTINGEAVTVDVLANDSDADGDALGIQSPGNPANGTVSITDADALRYFPDTNFSGTDSFNYTIADGEGGTDTASVAVTVEPANQAPVAGDDTTTTTSGEAVTIDVLANDSDADGDALSLQSPGNPANGTASITDADALRYTPDASFNGTDKFTYTVSDGNGGTDTASVEVTVEAANQVPVASDDTAATITGEAVTVDVLANDSDADGDALSIQSPGSPANGTVSITDADALRYTPDAGFNGTDAFTYTVSDGNGGTDTASVEVTVEAANQLPTASDDTATITSGEAVTVDVLANDSDADGDALGIQSPGSPANGTVSVTNADTIRYTPDAGFSGTDSFNYTLADGNGGRDTASVTVTVEPANQVPVASDDTATITSGEAVTVDVLANDSDADGDALGIQSPGSPANGTVSVTNADTIRYTPDTGFSGTDSFSYMVSDGNGGTNTASVAVTVEAANDEDDVAPPAPTVETFTLAEILELDEAGNLPDEYRINPDVPKDFGTLTIEQIIASGVNYDRVVDQAGNTSELGDDALAVYSVEDEAENVLEIAEDLDDAENISVTDEVISASQFKSLNALPNYTRGNEVVAYTPTEAFGGGGIADNSIIDSEAKPFNQDQLTVAGAAAALANVVNSAIAQANNTSDLDVGDVFVWNIEDDANAVLGADANQDAIAGAGSIFITDDVISLEQRENLDALSNYVPSGENVAPVATDDIRTLDKGSSEVFDVLSNDSDFDDDALSINGVGDPANGTVSVTNADTIRYTPDTGFSGTDSFSYMVSDGNGNTDTANVSVTVEPANQVPVASDDSATTTAGEAVTIDVLANDSDADGDALSIESPGNPANGTVSVTNADEILYTPDTGFSGTNNFNYTLSDGQGGTDTASVTVTVEEKDSNNDSNDSTSEGNASAFNEKAYLELHPDVAKAVEAGSYESGQEHFSRFGASEGRDSGSIFDESFYLSDNPDVAKAVERGDYDSGFAHYSRFGADEGRDPAGDSSGTNDAGSDENSDPSSLFSSSFYLSNNPDVAAAVESGRYSALGHFEKFGEAEGRDPSPLFDSSFYRANNQDVVAAVEDGRLSSALEHFENSGIGEGRSPNPDFDETGYLKAHSDVAAAVDSGSYESGLEHYVLFGADEGREPGGAVTIGESQPPTAYVGSENNTYPYNAVTYIESEFPNGKTYTGSGGVVGENDVLTASHVIYSPADGGLAESITVYPGRDGADLGYGSYKATFADYYEVDNDGDGLFNRAESEADLAVLGFDDGFGNQTGCFGLDAGASSGTYNLTGYPGAYRTEEGPRMTNDKGSVTEDDLYSVFNFDSIEASLGNSGGPLWYQEGGDVYIAGVASTGGWATDVASRYSDILDAIDGNNYLYEAPGTVATAETSDGTGLADDNPVALELAGVTDASQVDVAVV